MPEVPGPETGQLVAALRGLGAGADVGDDAAVTRTLERLLGAQFAGR